jgi:hypothetical protein
MEIRKAGTEGMKSISRSKTPRRRELIGEKRFL